MFAGHQRPSSQARSGACGAVAKAWCGPSGRRRFSGPTSLWPSACADGTQIAAGLALALVPLAVLAPAAHAYDAIQQRLAHAIFLEDLPPAAAPAAVCIVDSGVGSTWTLRDALRARVTVVPAAGIDDGPLRRHGTLVAQVIAASGERGTPSGMAPGTPLVSVKAGTPSLFVVPDVAAGILACLAYPAVKVINVSLDAPLDATQDPIREAADQALADDVNVVGAAGNAGQAASGWDTIPVRCRSDRSASAVRRAATRPELVRRSTPWAATSSSRVAPGRGGARERDDFAAAQVSAVLAALRTRRPALSAVAAGQALVRGARGVGRAPRLDAAGAFSVADSAVAAGWRVRR